MYGFDSKQSLLADGDVTSYSAKFTAEYMITIVEVTSEQSPLEFVGGKGTNTAG